MILFHLLLALFASCQPPEEPCTTPTVCITLSASKMGCDTDNSGGLTPDECTILRIDTATYYFNDCEARLFEARYNNSTQRSFHDLTDTSKIALYLTFPSRIECHPLDQEN